MKAKRSASDFVQDIVDWGERCLRHVDGMTLEQFLRDEKTIDAVDKCIRNIGEAAKQAVVLDPALKPDFPEFEADAAYAMRNILAHGYFKTDVEILWRTVTTSIPKIVSVAKEILARRMSKI
jgi:uncharacterized protein with HEPN domain